MTPQPIVATVASLLEAPEIDATESIVRGRFDEYPVTFALTVSGQGSVQSLWTEVSVPMPTLLRPTVLVVAKRTAQLKHDTAPKYGLAGEADFDRAHCV